MKKINKLQLKKSVIAKLATADMNQAAGGKIEVPTAIQQYSDPCTGIVSCYPTANDCYLTGDKCPETLLFCN